MHKDIVCERTVMKTSCSVLFMFVRNIMSYHNNPVLHSMV